MAAGQFIAGGAAPLLVAGFGGEYEAYGYMAALFAGVILLAGGISFAGTRGVVYVLPETGPASALFGIDPPSTMALRVTEPKQHLSAR